MPVNDHTNRQMDPLPSVFGGERSTPHAIFEKSRAENEGTTTNHRPNDLALGCPTCKAQTGETVRMFAREGVGYYCLKGHTWKDIDQLMSMNPEKLEFKGQKARQEGYRKLELEMPGSTLDALQAKYGDRLARTVEALMDVLAQSRALVIHEEDLTRIEQNLGVQLRNGRDLVGITYERANAFRELNETVERGKAQEAAGRPAVTSTSINLELGDLHDSLVNLANGREQSLQQLIQGTLRQYQENGWI